MLSLPYNEVSIIFKLIDADDSGEISFEEFTTALEHLQYMDQKNQKYNVIGFNQLVKLKYVFMTSYEWVNFSIQNKSKRKISFENPEVQLTDKYIPCTLSMPLSLYINLFKIILKLITSWIR